MSNLRVDDGTGSNPMVMVGRVAAVVAGVALVGWVLDAAIRTFMLPRASNVRLSRWIGLAIAAVINTMAPKSRSYAWRDKAQAFRGPLTLLGYQATWLLIVFVGFTLVFWGVDGIGLGAASRESGSALFTLGFASPAGNGSLLLVYAEALIGLTLLALLISYLPTIYAAFQKREFMVAKLAVRAGTPSAPWHALVVAHATNSLSYMDSTMWGEWEDWFIDIAESHTSLAVLNFYRSPDPRNHWISAARTVLDTAAFRIAVVDIPNTLEARVTIRSGSFALRTLADYFRFPYSPDPRPDDPISVTREQFDAACVYMASSGIPLVADLDQAWLDFAGWRVNYDTIIEAAAVLVDAPPSPWDTVHTAVSPFATGNA
jgi:hypothetical protein